MNKKLISSLLCILSSSTIVAENYTQYVDPYIGTGGHGHVFLGANVPFGGVQVGPTQHKRGWDWCSGYHYSDSTIIGFGQLHLSGTGIGDLGDIGLFPATNAWDKEANFSHKAEIARPGYYSVTLSSGVKVELTATERVAFHRYTYPTTEDKAYLSINLNQGIGWDEATDVMYKLISPTEIIGYRKSTGWAKDQRVFFAIKLSENITLEKNSSDSIAVLSLNNKDIPLLAKVGISAVSIENAKENIQQEIPNWNFKEIVNSANDAWNKQLSKISIKTSNIKDKKVFYTALYHTMFAPSVFGDVNSQYRGADGNTYKADFTPYSTFSLWDTYRTAHPLMTIIHPDKQKDIAETFLHIFQQQGKLPVWYLAGNETDCMVGNPGIPVLVDIALKGYDVDKKEVLKATKTSALLDERGLGLLKKYGYIPTDLDPEYETVAKGLEYALADACIAKIAKNVGDKKTHKYFLKRSQSYKDYYFDRETKFMRGVTSKRKFREPFDPFNSVHRQDDYTEGNAWQYIWLVPHDVHGLIKIFGGEKPFINKLDSLFIIEGNLGKEASPDISGLIGQYAHGNEPSHHILYLYNYAGQPYKAAPYLRYVMNNLYNDSTDGLSGNEDVGQMSAWYILSSLGLYQVEPAGGKYIFGSPIFDEATIDVGNGKTFTILAHNNNKENMYIQSATLNGKPYTYSYINFNDIMNGGKLEFTMGNKPSTFGTKVKDRP